MSVYSGAMSKAIKPPRKKDEDGLTPIERRLALEYMVHLNAAAASRACSKTAMVGWQVLQRPHVQAFIHKENLKRADRLNITADSIKEEMAKIAFANMGDFITIDENGALSWDFSRMTRAQMAAIAEISVEPGRDGQPKIMKFKLLDKKGALADLAKTLGLFNTVRPAKDAALTGAPRHNRGMTEDEIDQRLDDIHRSIKRGREPNAGEGKAVSGKDVSKLRPN